MKQGLVHAYCGNGKGKTTAALGLALRSLGRDQRVVMIQFLKTSETGELMAAARWLPQFQILRFEKPHGFYRNLSEEERIQLKKDIDQAIDQAEQLLREAGCDLLILDECLGAIEKGLIPVDTMIELIRNKHPETELVLTGRVLPEALTPHIDYITRMDAVKHPYDRGIMAREGIEY